MKQHYILVEKLKQNLIICLLLGDVERLDVFEMGLTSMIQAPHFFFIQSQETLVGQLFQRSGRAVGGIQQFVTGHLVQGWLLRC